MLSTDSRWSSDNGDWIAYVDDTGYDKLAFTPQVGFLFAGDMPPIDAWKTYVSRGMKKSERPAPPTVWIPGTRVTIIQVALADGRIMFKSHNFANTSFGAATRALFAGTGAEAAKICWDEKKCARTAVETAATKDCRSGGKVVYLDRKTREHNIVNSATSVSVQDQLKDRGYFMSVTQPVPVLLKDAANDPSNPAAQAFAKAVMSGAAPLTAPFPGMDEPWAPEKFGELDAALSEFEQD